MSKQQLRARGHSRGEKNRFMIKVRLSSRENQESREEAVEGDRATDEDVTQFISYMIDRSQRLRDLVDRKAIHNEQAFYQKHLINSVCLKTILKQMLDKMMADRRLGKNLKGMNKSNLVQLENAVWAIIEREAALYLCELQYQRDRKVLIEELANRKEQLMQEIERLEGLRQSQEIERLEGLRQSQEDNFMLTSSESKG